ncbi:MAG: c-type cytochrome [Anaerolineae bacterium]|nr:c-type cytochrome [Anaerolineae bacterium]
MSLSTKSKTLWWAVAVVAVVLLAALSLASPASPAAVAAQAPGAVTGATALPPAPAALVPIPEGASPMQIALIQAGREYARRLGCLSCHSLTERRLIGPSFRGLYGSMLRLEGGFIVEATDAYLRRAIVSFHDRPVEGFPGLVMPDYSGAITGEQMDALMAFLEALAAPVAAAAPAATPTADRAAEDQQLAQELWQILQQADYQDNWSTIPGKGTFYTGQFPHGMLLSTYLNPEAALAVASQSGSMPDGAIIVKENYLEDRTLDAYTVMWKREGYNPGHNDWFWAKYGPGGALDIAGAVPGCISCHGSVWSNDYIFSAPIAPINPSVPNPGAAMATPAPTVTVPAETSLAQAGRQYVQQLGCLTCHTTTGTPLIGPTFLGLYGSSVTLDTGEQVVADEEYLRRSIIAAHAQVVEGFPGGIMPDYSTLTTPEQIEAMVAYLRTLGEAEAPAATPEAAATVPPALAEEGRLVALQMGCFTCHTSTGQILIGPTFQGLYGSTVTLDTGEQVVADEEYLRRSILGAHQQTVEGFPGQLMPNYAGLLDDQEVEVLIAYIRSLS